MDWNKTLDGLWEAARRVFTCAAVIVLILVSVSGTYLIGLALWWLIQHAQKFFGT